MNIEDRIKTKCLFDPPLPEDGYRICIARYFPRGKTLDGLTIDRNYPQAGPDLWLLNAWSNGKIDWQEYTILYTNSLPVEITYYFVEMAKRHIITLLCYEKEDNPHCHRHILRQMVIDRWNELNQEKVSDNTGQ